MANEFEKNEEVKDEKAIDGEFEETTSENTSETKMIDEKKKAKLSKKKIAGICLAAVAAVGAGVVIGMKLGANIKPPVKEITSWKTVPEEAAKMLTEENYTAPVVENVDDAVEVTTF